MVYPRRGIRAGSFGIRRLLRRLYTHPATSPRAEARVRAHNALASYLFPSPFARSLPFHAPTAAERSRGRRAGIAGNEVVLTLRFGLLGHRGSQRQLHCTRRTLLTRCSEPRAVSIRPVGHFPASPTVRFPVSFIDTPIPRKLRRSNVIGRIPAHPPECTLNRCICSCIVSNFQLCGSREGDDI